MTAEASGEDHGRQSWRGVARDEVVAQLQTAGPSGAADREESSQVTAALIIYIRVWLRKWRSWPAGAAGRKRHVPAILGSKWKRGDFFLHAILKETTSYQKASQPVRCADVQGRNAVTGFVSYVH